ncbi:YihY family inner membrane protein [Thiomicrospira microaerophila]|uniref:YihY family inner membrane protein n=1 Tax=Thiomicrospira microaerophila TaxID=406020 RepID=UPI00201065B8|nr:YihY family inner membrane protein [Thiomicrospira microaerophila]UQB42647.1 YihY family inner membrane protein [Thiomicrospira microaerophila]
MGILMGLNFWKKVFLRFWHQRGSEAVAILAYTTLIGLVPMLAVMLSLFSASEWFEPFQHLVMQLVVAHLMPESQPVIQSYLTLFAEQASRLTTPGLVVMLVTTLILLWTIDQKINAMWNADYQRRWWVSLLNYLGVSLLGPLLLGLSLVASSYVLAWPLLLGDMTVSRGVNQLMSSLPLIFSVLGFMLLFKFVPMSQVSWKQAWWVALMASIKVELLKTGFAWYISAFPTYDLVYGALAAVPVFLLWLYLMWFILIWNACVLAEWTCSAGAKN